MYTSPQTQTLALPAGVATPSIVFDSAGHVEGYGVEVDNTAGAQAVTAVAAGWSQEGTHFAPDTITTFGTVAAGSVGVYTVPAAARGIRFIQLTLTSAVGTTVVLTGRGS